MFVPGKDTGVLRNVNPKSREVGSAPVCLSARRILEPVQVVDIGQKLIFLQACDLF